MYPATNAQQVDGRQRGCGYRNPNEKCVWFEQISFGLSVLPLYMSVSVEAPEFSLSLLCVKE